MKFFAPLKRHRIALALVALAFLLLPGFAPAAPKPLLVYYMPWYVAKPFSDTWGWHWTMDHFNPDVTDASGEKQIASWYHPLIGPYDSADPVVLEYHVLLMKLAGIDGVIVDWYGRESHLDYGINNERTAALFQYTRKAGLKFALCYEDRTVLQQINDGVLAATNAILHAQQTMLYVQNNYFGDPSYLQWSNRPVLLNFGPQYFKTNEQWEQIFSVLEATNHPAFFTEDNRLPLGVGAFNWPPMWLSLAPGARGVLSVAALENYLANFEQNSSTWPAFISSAFPRFHDVYQPAGVRDYWGYLGDRKGEMLRMTLTRAMTNHSALVQIVTWNDFGEGTVVETTSEYGYRDLGIIQDCRRQYLDAGFPLRTNDLKLATRLYHQRRAAGFDSKRNAALDQVFAAIIQTNLTQAEKQLQQLEGKTTAE
ncbi:MAG: glycoside hydrolase family 71/99-like protein [Verrucomicrobiota bacterium]